MGDEFEEEAKIPSARQLKDQLRKCNKPLEQQKMGSRLQPVQSPIQPPLEDRRETTDRPDTAAISNRADAVLLARLPAGHTALLKFYANLLDASTDSLCPNRQLNTGCGEHWLREKKTFRSPFPPLGVLTINPERVLELTLSNNHRRKCARVRSYLSISRFKSTNDQLVAIRS